MKTGLTRLSTGPLFTLESIMTQNIFRFIFLFLLHLSIPLTADQYHVTPQNRIVHLPEDLKISWAIVFPPESITNVMHFQFTTPQNGWANFKDHKTAFWQLRNGEWSKYSFTEMKFYNTGTLFSITGQNVWFTYNTSIPYKQNLYFFDGVSGQVVETPNTAGIRSLWLDSSDHGWAGCDWGQILEYNGENWYHVPCPTMHHIQKIFSVGRNEWYAITDKYFEFLHYDGNTWEMSTLPDSLFFEQFILVCQMFLDEALSAEVFKRFQNKVKHFFKQAVPSDTLIFSTYIKPGCYFWAHTNAPVMGCFTSLRKDFLNVPAEEIVFIANEKEKAVRNEFWIDTYAFFSREGLKRRVVVRMPAPEREQKNLPGFQIGAESQPFEHGICISDLTGDGYEDKYTIVTRGGNRLNIYQNYQPLNRSYQNAEMAEELGIDGPSRTEDAEVYYDEGTSSADIDNDGDQDLLVTSLYGKNILFKQGRKGRFREMGASIGVKTNIGFSVSGAWGDVNNDGFLDLYISNQDLSNRLYLNNGAGFFEDVTKRAGLWQDRGGSGSAMADVDDDGDLDIFVPRRGMRNLLYINNGVENQRKIPQFSEKGLERGIAGVDTIAHSACGVFADVDNDGDLDLFVTNMTGCNRLYLNDGRGYFTDHTISAGFVNFAISVASVFLDADHDGDLDLYVGNRGLSRYYQNDGQGRFSDRTDEMQAGYEGFVSGMAVWDVNLDGDLDISISDDQSDSRCLKNLIDDNRFIMLYLYGTVSNRDAVGTKVYLYPFGSIGNKDSLLAMRQVESGGNSNGMNSRKIHFGIPDGKAKDLLIRFPSGICRRLSGLQSGETYTVYEEDGWPRHLSYFKKWVSRTVRSPLNQREALFVFSFLMLIIITHLFLIRSVWWTKKIALFSFVIPLGIFFLFYLSFFDPLSWLGHAVPFGISLLFCIAGIVYGRRIWGVWENEAEQLEKLFFILKGFFHGEWGARKFNRLMLYCSNLEPGEHVSQEMQQKLEESIRDYYALVLPEIERTSAYAAVLQLEGGIPHQLKCYSLELSKILNQLKIEVKLNTIEKKTINAVLEQISGLQRSLKSLRQSIHTFFSSDVCRIIKELCIDESLPVLLNCPLDNSFLGLIRPAEFSQIMRNLIDNAQRAVENSASPEIKISVKGNLDMIKVSVADNGKGVPAGFVTRLFREQLTSKMSEGGFGLYMADQTLRKYSGQIQLKQNGPDQETIFQIQLKRTNYAG